MFVGLWRPEFRAEGDRGQVPCVLLTLVHLSNDTVHKKTDLYVTLKSEDITEYRIKRRSENLI